MNATDPLLVRIAGEFHEMPGLRLNLAQASRFWQLDHSVCQAVLHALVQRRIVHRTMDGYYIGHSQPRQIKAATEPLDS